jgi:hypothetical protein
MKKAIFAALLFAFAASALVGCKAEVGVDPDGRVAASAPSAR